ncbi:transketolase, partial [uncultured Campylobacter sp.]|uniref:transketolase n=1 Tax=uncultured Campylobacter sp. TaxID=218934 RepID=UPI00263A0F7C
MLKKMADTIRFLCADMVQQANSGHPGAPMGLADVMVVLAKFLNHNPKNPNWLNRDRLVFSGGHASSLVYSFLHLSGYDLSLDDLKNFRQLGSKTPGHPEYGYAPGVETTTGPLGQGITNAVGMAIAEKTLAGQFNREGHEIVDHHTYVFLGDGCLMEGISHEACSLAGTLGLGKLIAFYDDNNISIDGHVDGWFTDDTQKRFEAYGWQVIPAIDGHNPAQIIEAIKQAQAETNKPTLIICKTIIGFGSPNKSNSHDCHGAPLGDEEIALTRKALNWDYAPFEIPADVYAQWDAKAKGAELEKAWHEKFAAYAKAYPELAAEFTRRMEKNLPADWAKESQAFIEYLQANPASIASRKASQNTIEAYAKVLPELLGGSADLASSNLTLWSGSKPIRATQNVDGNYLNYGVREFGMAAIMNGIALHGGFIPYGATFLMFYEYAHNAVRMAALMKQRSLFVFTHDSIGLGEDGPTHQPVEQTSALRLIPNLNTWRPCDQVESAIAWKAAIERTDGPSALIFTRQNLAQMDRTSEQLANVARGAYVLKDCAGTPDLIFIATGSEVELAVKAAEQLTAEG